MPGHLLWARGIMRRIRCEALEQQSMRRWTLTRLVVWLMRRPKRCLGVIHARSSIGQAEDKLGGVLSSLRATRRFLHLARSRRRDGAS